MRENWSAALGIEVENRRMLGKCTLFVYDKPIPLIATYTHFNNPVPPVISYQHIYFTEQYLKLHGYAEVFNYLNQIEVTLEVSPQMLSEIPKPLLQCHIVLSLYVKGVDQYVKLSDTIRLLLDDYHTASVTFADMVITRPFDYKDDTCAGIKEMKAEQE